MENKIIHTSDAPAPIGPYSQAILSGNTLYVSGQIAIDAFTDHLVQDNIKKETGQVMENVKAVLAAAGMALANVVKSSIFIKNMDDFREINEVYAQYMGIHQPARETVEVSRLPKDANVEISVVAVRVAG